MAGRPAMLEGGLLVRKGDAEPVIPDNSPLTESLEAATLKVVPLHRVTAPADDPVPDAAPPPVEFPTQIISPRRRVIIILAALLVLCLIAFALAARGTGDGVEPGPPLAAATTGALTAPEAAPASPTELSAVTPPAAQLPPAVAKPTPAPVPPAATAAIDPLPIVAAPEKPRTVSPVLLPVPRPKLYVLQFASVGGKRRAFEEAVRLQKHIGGIIGGRKIVVVNSEVGGRTRYRLRAGSFGSLRTAISVCRRVARFDVDCLPIRR